MTNPYAAYVKSSESVETKEELLIKVFEEILSLLNISIYAIEEGDIKTKAENLTKVTDAVAVLQASLDMEKGGEIAKNLYSIYEFCLEELIKANATNDKEKIKQIIEVLTPIYEGFKEAVKKIRE
ncbi:flagellar export chaperone FliS [Persephonella sp.]|uniref:flagellar export chaperone FliS n=3 Tax=Persephonella sp. TaxID=2060922 RepID=UPI0025DF7EB5|nr:flagellar export chaperone FliS [Persephonella sp.]